MRGACALMAISLLGLARPAPGAIIDYLLLLFSRLRLNSSQRGASMRPLGCLGRLHLESPSGAVRGCEALPSEPRGAPQLVPIATNR